MAREEVVPDVVKVIVREVRAAGRWRAGVRVRMSMPVVVRFARAVVAAGHGMVTGSQSECWGSRLVRVRVWRRGRVKMLRCRRAPVSSV